jgi:hypothetical protein
MYSMVPMYQVKCVMYGTYVSSKVCHSVTFSLW